MERTKKINESLIGTHAENNDPVGVGLITAKLEHIVLPTKLRWRKVGGGSLRLNLDGANRIIKPGEIFLADLEELPKAFMDTLECLDSEGLKTAAASERAKEPIVVVEYTLKKVGKKADDTWNLVDSEGKALNEKPLSKEAAEELLTALKA
ncbi:MAG: hypothetical protein WC827_03970 [Candidatus Paceibacterota bacterium]|jgi:hypothetical protein